MNTGITVKQLRGLLFQIDSQELTVRELRTILFGTDNQGSFIESRALNALIKEHKSERIFYP